MAILPPLPGCAACCLLLAASARLPRPDALPLLFGISPSGGCFESPGSLTTRPSNDCLVKWNRNQSRSDWPHKHMHTHMHITSSHQTRLASAFLRLLRLQLDFHQRITSNPVCLRLPLMRVGPIGITSIDGTGCCGCKPCADGPAVLAAPSRPHQSRGSLSNHDADPSNLRRSSLSPNRRARRRSRTRPPMSAPAGSGGGGCPPSASAARAGSPAVDAAVQTAAEANNDMAPALTVAAVEAIAALQEQLHVGLMRVHVPNVLCIQHLTCSPSH